MSAQQSILIVEDDRVMRETLAAHLGRTYRVATAGSCAEARRAYDKMRVEVAILDLNLPDGDGLSLVGPFRRDGGAEVVVITAYPKAQSAVRALKAGALDYINKPFELDEFEIVVNKAAEVRRLRDEVSVLRRQRPKGGGAERFLGEAPAITRLREEIRSVARTPDTTVLILGESGSGKELVAEAVHYESQRRNGPLVRVNCSSIPSTMLEAELFGHERGAFTDAKTARKGLIELAQGGTLFLDEIGDLPLELQPKLLRVLESRSFRRLGGNREYEADVRFVTATNRNLEAMAADGRFREDLYFRLRVFEISVPPLRDRRTDIPLLAEYFLGELRRHLGASAHSLAPDVLRHFYSYRWPGNARELKNVIERGLILASGVSIELGDLPSDLRPHVPDLCSPGCPAFPDGFADFPSVAEIERRYLLCVYRRCDSNKTQAAKVLGISRVTLREKLRQYAIDDGKKLTD